MSQQVIALSLKARGLTITPAIPAERHKLLSNLGHSLLDISVAIAIQVVLLSWSTWVSVVLIILCCVFYANYNDGAMAASDGSIMIPIALLIYLPCLGLVYTTASRRLEAQRHLEQIQSLVVGMYVIHSGLAGCGAPQLLSQLDDAISDTMGQLQGYLCQPRELSSMHFSPALLRGEQLPRDSKLLALCTDVGQRLRRLHACLCRLSGTAGALLAHCSSSTEGQQAYQQQVLSLVQLLVPLSSSLQALLSLKDLRSPLMLRAMMRPAVVVLAPLLTGSFLAGWGLIGRPVTAAGQLFAIVTGCILQILLMSLYTLGVMLEDPFDTGPDAAPDTISLLEFMHSLSYLTAPNAGGDVADVPDGGSQDVAVNIKEQSQLQQQEGQQQHDAGLGQDTAGSEGLQQQMQRCERAANSSKDVAHVMVSH